MNLGQDKALTCLPMNTSMCACECAYVHVCIGMFMHVCNFIMLISTFLCLFQDPCFTPVFHAGMCWMAHYGTGQAPTVFCGMVSTG